jgi:crotonobetainyl-CoA:carnitine CoA-transferase CaiB-like acyl-CoA transferase
MADSVFARLATAMQMPNLATDKRFAKAVDRNDNEDALDDIIAGWTARHDLADIEQTLLDAAVPASRIYDVSDIFQDAHYRARDMLVEVPDAQLGSVTLMGITPKLSQTPGSIRHAGGRIGEHTREILADRCGLSASDIDRLAQTGVVACATPVESIQTRAAHA